MQDYHNELYIGSSDKYKIVHNKMLKYFDIKIMAI